VLPLIADLGPTELLIILAIVVLIFGASKLPELARGSGRALRIFKAETKGLGDDDEEARRTTASAQDDLAARQAAERDALEARQAAERDAAVTKSPRGDDTSA
jgi:sec-independent protein translocase protein TatA